jgi:hypothetical protein
VKRVAGILIALIAAAQAPAATRLLLTIVDPKTSAAVSGLEAGDFQVTDDRTPRNVEGVEFSRDTLDIMMLLDTSLVGPMVAPLAEEFVAQLQASEQMAVVSYHSSADLIQDFTSSRQLILRSIGKVKFGNEPRVLDALYAAIDGGFRSSPFRRVILLLTSGAEGASRTDEREVIGIARGNGVSIYPVYVSGGERGLFERLARATGGASFAAGELKSNKEAKAGARVFDVMRSHYTLTLAGNLPVTEKLKIEIKKAPKARISVLPLD